MNLNTPECVLQVPAVPPWDRQQRNIFDRIVDNISGRLMSRGTEIVIKQLTPELGHLVTIPTQDLKEFHEQNAYKEDYVVFKWPRATMIQHGYVLVGPHWTKFKFDDIFTEFRVIWGEGIDEDGKLGTRPDLIEAVDLVNSTLSPRKHDLDGAIIEFSIHDGGVGLDHQRLIFWGYRGIDSAGRKS